MYYTKYSLCFNIQKTKKRKGGNEIYILISLFIRDFFHYSGI